MRIFLLADYYEPYLNYFYGEYDTVGLTYEEHLNVLLSDYFGGFVSYYHHFAKLGHDVRLVIGNDKRMQDKWVSEHGIAPGSMSKYDVVMTQIDEFRPDIFFIGSMFDYYGNFIEKVSKITKNIFAWIACPFKDSLDLSNITCIISSAEDYADLFRRKGLKAEVLNAAFDEDIIEMLDNRKVYDVTFIGGLSKKTHSKRVEGLEYIINSGIDLHLFGYGLDRNFNPFKKSLIRKQYGGERWGIKMYKTLNNSRISLNFHIDVAKGFSGNMRMYEATGCGSMLMTENTTDIESIFQPGREVVTYSDFNDLVSKIKYYLENERDREMIARAGQKACLERHGYDKRIMEFERILLKYSE